MNTYQALRRIAKMIDEEFSIANIPGSPKIHNNPKLLEEILLIALEAVKEADQPANTVELPAIQHILSRDQRDALVAINTLLASMQNGTEGLYRHRLQKLMNVVSDMLYGEK